MPKWIFQKTSTDQQGERLAPAHILFVPTLLVGCTTVSYRALGQGIRANLIFSNLTWNIDHALTNFTVNERVTSPADWGIRRRWDLIDRGHYNLGGLGGFWGFRSFWEQIPGFLIRRPQKRLDFFTGHDLFVLSKGSVEKSSTVWISSFKYVVAWWIDSVIIWVFEKWLFYYLYWWRK